MRQHMAELVGRLRTAVERRGEEFASTALLSLLGIVTAEHAPGDSDEPDDRLAGVAEMFGLTPVEMALLTAVVAPDLDANVAALYGHLRGLPGPSRIDIGLALELVSLPTMSPYGITALGAAGRLRRHGLVEPADQRPWLLRELAAPERVLAHLLGASDPDPVLAQLTTHPLPLQLTETEQLARTLAAGAPLVWIRSPLGTAGSSLAAGALERLEVHYRCLDLGRIPEAEPILDLLRSAVLEAGLAAQALILCGAERLGVEGAPVQAVLTRSVVPIVAVGTTAWDSRWAEVYPWSIDAPTLDPSSRNQAWQNLGAAEATSGLTGLRLSPEAIGQTAAYAHWLAVAQDRPISDELVRQAARRIGGSASATRPLSGRRHGFADLVLPENISATLLRLVGWARNRDEVLERGTLLQSGSKGSGLTAMFTGSPGTGKTLAAHVIADELGIDLVQVDLSSIVDKYIGETEKNLERVFHQAESLNVVLFFDEADALFGRRSEVKDSHDRHANQEVAYLLQRMENFDGLTILATNLRGNLDPAFSRRMSFIVHFPDPDVPTRRRLWAAHLERLGPLDPSDPVDLDQLAEAIELSGGDIRNIVLAAGYDAAAAGVRPGMRHVLDAAVGEYQKLGRRVPNDGFRRDRSARVGPAGILS